MNIKSFVRDSEKHIKAYVKYMQEKKLLPATQRLELSSIRLMYDQIPNAKNIAQEGREVPLTFHGLRHSCASNWYKSLIDKDYSDYKSRKQISLWLGYHRVDIVNIYLTGVRDGDCA